MELAQFRVENGAHAATQGVDGSTPLYCASGSPREDLEIEPFLAEDNADMTAERPNRSLERGHRPAVSSSNAVPMRQPRMGRQLYRASQVKVSYGTSWFPRRQRSNLCSDTSLALQRNKDLVPSSIHRIRPSNDFMQDVMNTVVIRKAQFYYQPSNERRFGSVSSPHNFFGN